MRIEVYENYDGSKLVAMLVEADGTERELVRSDAGNDDMLNKIDSMNLSHLTVTFHWASAALSKQKIRDKFLENPEQAFAVAFNLVQKAAAYENPEERIKIIAQVANEFGVDISDCSY
ncbi:MULTISPECIES: hypothetical protein [Paenibacillus]|uniref:hypothetical protein n=1 Tax=Paenibacillus TaxID=44249 RepID=UPI000416F06E|nr:MULTISPECIES: hypothetical protein [Paenibacillus]KGP81121.1 hypothetical protein P364_0117665 [Paenibacillus sp. MAEPY2]KGP86169.1 hypothetical protein P363_0119045 [Paenibacillus sp. MAEPY1]OZQ71029.1 hypothetical protein CA599_10855 [Paenibacillus taichungensis]